MTATSLEIGVDLDAAIACDGWLIFLDDERLPCPYTGIAEIGWRIVCPECGRKSDIDHVCVGCFTNGMTIANAADENIYKIQCWNCYHRSKDLSEWVVSWVL